MIEYKKTKSIAKVVIPSGPTLDKVIDVTMDLIVKVVGGTLGPGGRPVLLERAENDLPPFVTKDGVTVFRSLGVTDPVGQVLIETVRDASLRTAATAGDGTTTVTILSHSFRARIKKYCSLHPEVSPQAVIRSLYRIYDALLQPKLQGLRIPVTMDDKAKCVAVAAISANGDQDLAEATYKAFEICGDEGNVQIVEGNGEYGYPVDKVEGYPILNSGFEYSCSRYYPIFINDAATQRVLMDKPMFILYFGPIKDPQQISPLLLSLQQAWRGGNCTSHNVVIMATSFSDSVLEALGGEWGDGMTINAFPYAIPRSPFANGQKDFLDDVCAIVGGKVFDPVTNLLTEAKLEDIGNLIVTNTEDVLVESQLPKWGWSGVNQFECQRYKATIFGRNVNNLENLEWRIDEVAGQSKSVESQLEQSHHRERLAKLTGGIARLTVVGSSNGDIKERAARADDAVCALRGALKDGALPGGTRALVDLSCQTPPDGLEGVWNEIVVPALQQPLRVLCGNAGYSPEEIDEVLQKLIANALGNKGEIRAYDVAKHEMVDAVEGGLLDSFPAVADALRNSLSIASQIGTLGGVICQPRDAEWERKDARDTAEFLRHANENPAEDRV